MFQPRVVPAAERIRLGADPGLKCGDESGFWHVSLLREVIRPPCVTSIMPTSRTGTTEVEELNGVQSSVGTRNIMY